MAMVFLVRCRLHLSEPCRRRAIPGGSRRLHECGCFVGAVVRLRFYCACRAESIPTEQSCLVETCCAV